jgi:hypothetical protein
MIGAPSVSATCSSSGRRERAPPAEHRHLLAGVEHVGGAAQVVLGGQARRAREDVDAVAGTLRFERRPSFSSSCDVDGKLMWATPRG